MDRGNPMTARGWRTQERKPPGPACCTSPEPGSGCGAAEPSARVAGSRYVLHDAGSPASNPVFQACSRCSGVPWWLGLAVSKSPTARAASSASCTSPSSSGRPGRRCWPTCPRSSRPGARTPSSAAARRTARRGRARPGPRGRTRAPRCRRPRSRRSSGRSPASCPGAPGRARRRRCRWRTSPRCRACRHPGSRRRRCRRGCRSRRRRRSPRSGRPRSTGSSPWAPAGRRP